MDRRQSLKIILSVPVGIIVGYNSKLIAGADKVVNISSAQALKKLIILFGPWSIKQKQEAEDFANRFIKARHLAKPFLGESVMLLQSIAKHFSDKDPALKEINLEEFSAKEQHLLSQLVSQLYGLREVRYLAANQQPYGVCLPDPKSYVNSPSPQDNV